MEFESDVCVIKKGSAAVMAVPRVGNVYKVQCEPHAAMMVEHAVQQTDWKLWHTHLGH